MVSQKKCDLKSCIKCGVLLCPNNWLSYLQKRSNYICTPCFREYGKNHYKLDANYNNKQKARYRSRRSAVIYSYGNECIKCGEEEYWKLTIASKNKTISNSTIDFLYNTTIQKDGYSVQCYNCAAKNINNYSDKYALRDKIKVIKHYGNKCSSCEEDDIKCLMIAQKNGVDFQRHSKSGSSLYRFLIKNRYPDMCQIFCYNCYYVLAGIKLWKASVLDASISEAES